MQLEHSFTIPADVDQAWTALLDLERVASCLPGARIESVSDGVYHGVIDVTVGPISLAYRGTAEFLDQDPHARRAVLAARTREARGSGTANATITANLLAEAPGTTRVRVSTALDITGRPAQFGTGVLTEVGNRILAQFADRMATELARPSGGPPTGTSTTPDDNSVNLLRLAAIPVLKRIVVPVTAVIGVALAITAWRSAQRRPSTPA